MVDLQSQALRDSLRRARRQLNPRAQAQAAEQVARRVAAMDCFLVASRVAFYQAVDGELDPQPLLDHALALGKTCCLPVMTEDSTAPLKFAPIAADTTLQPNAFGILEPPAVDLMAAATLDLVLVPLVGFDSGCVRLGMGKGFYDRAFHFKLTQPDQPPFLLGLAHDCQRVERLTSQAWDVGLDAVVSGEKTYRP